MPCAHPFLLSLSTGSYGQLLSTDTLPPFVVLGPSQKGPSSGPSHLQCSLQMGVIIGSPSSNSYSSLFLHLHPSLYNPSRPHFLPVPPPSFFFLRPPSFFLFLLRLLSSLPPVPGPCGRLSFMKTVGFTPEAGMCGGLQKHLLVCSRAPTPSSLAVSGPQQWRLCGPQNLTMPPIPKDFHPLHTARWVIEFPQLSCSIATGRVP